MQASASGICECDAVVVYIRLVVPLLIWKRKLIIKRREGIIMVAVVVVVVLRW